MSLKYYILKNSKDKGDIVEIVDAEMTKGGYIRFKYVHTSLSIYDSTIRVLPSEVFNKVYEPHAAMNILYGTTT